MTISVVLSGLKDLTDFLPASLATIVSYFSDEVRRGVWKPVFMNGIDWPNPAANLSNVEEYIKKILATTGVDIPSLAPGKTMLFGLPIYQLSISLQYDYLSLNLWLVLAVL